jgi:hypothetical protein
MIPISSLEKSIITHNRHLQTCDPIDITNRQTDPSTNITEVVLSQRPYIYPGSVSLPDIKFHQFNECTNSILVPVFHR